MENKKKDNNKIAKIIVALGSLLVIGVAVWSLTYKTPEKTNLDLKEESIKVTETKTAPEVKKEVKTPEVKTEVKKEEAKVETKSEVKAEEPKEVKAEEVEKKEEAKVETKTEAPKVEAAKPVETKTETKVETKPATEVKKPVATKPVATTKPAETKPTTKPTKPVTPAPRPVVTQPKVEAPKPAPKPAAPAPKPAPTQPKPVAPTPKPAPKPAVTVVSTTTETKEEIRDVVKFTSTTKLNNTQYTDWSAVDQAGKDGFTKYTLSRTVTKMSDGTVKYGDWKTTSTVVEPMVPEVIAKGTMERSQEGWDYEAIEIVIAEINKYRASKGLPQATFTKTNYAAKMMAERGFNHFGGSNEIIAAGSAPHMVVKGWARSGGHRTTLELPGNVHYYVGVYRNANGHPYYSVALEG